MATFEVLNLIINGIPSILKLLRCKNIGGVSFKPYYKWNTFNTQLEPLLQVILQSFKPYYKWNTFNTQINQEKTCHVHESFKPYYKWNTFNTLDLYKDIDFVVS